MTDTALNTSRAALKTKIDTAIGTASIDDARNAGKVAPYVNGKAWDYEVYIDSNQDFKRALNVNNVPHTFLVNGEGEIVWQHNSYSEGDEDELYEAVKKLAAGKELDY